MIRELTLAESRHVDGLAEELRMAQWIVTPVFRAALPHGVERALEAVAALRFDASRDDCLAAIRAVLEPDSRP
jgi:hypothetical protein